MSSAFYPQGMNSWNNRTPQGGYKSWKGSGIFSNPTGITSTHIRPLTNKDPGNFFPTGFGLPRPIKHHRKGRFAHFTGEMMEQAIENPDLERNVNRTVKSSKGSSLGGGSGGTGMISQMIGTPGSFIMNDNQYEEKYVDGYIKSIKSKGLTGNQGFTIGYPIDKDMLVMECAELPSDFAPNNVGIPEGSNLASFWNDWGNDVFDDWGFFYIFDVATNQYYFPILTPENLDDGILTTQVFNAFGRSYTITHGYPTRGIFKIDVSCSDNSIFIFGAYGNMGSDEKTINTDLTHMYSLNNKFYTLYYNRNEDPEPDPENNPIVNDEKLFSYFIPYNSELNNSKTYNNFVYNNDDLSLYSVPVSKGITIYFSNADLKEWIINDLTLIELDVSKDCKTCQGVSVVSDWYPITNLTEKPQRDTTNPLLCCSQQRKARQRTLPTSTLVKKNYFQTTHSYLYNRCQTFEQRQFNFVYGVANQEILQLLSQYPNISPKVLAYIKPGDPLSFVNTYVAQCNPNVVIDTTVLSNFLSLVAQALFENQIITKNEYDILISINIGNIRAFIIALQQLPPDQAAIALAYLYRIASIPYNGQFIIGPSNPKGCSQVYYKPNNPQYAQQGGVSSTTRTLKLNYDTIQTNSAFDRKFRGANSAAEMSLMNYPEVPFAFKYKVQQCSKSTYNGNPFFFQGQKQKRQICTPYNVNV